MQSVFWLSVSFRTQFRFAVARANITDIDLFALLAMTVHWSLPRFSFFVKVPCWRRMKNHFSVPPLTNLFCRPPVGRGLGVRWSILVRFNLSWSHTGHCQSPPFSFFPASLVLRLRFPSILFELRQARPAPLLTAQRYRFLFSVFAFTF